ncbi:MAG: class I SAM-dependent methyltransferase [Oscillospiraceae bacterium]
MERPNAYESGCMQEVMGDALRPGGFILTDFAAEYCALTTKNSVLDLGCGRGATVRHLFEKYAIEALGVDSSEKLIEEAGNSYGFDAFVRAEGENLPFEDDSFDCVFAECSLSLMDADAALKQVRRVLRGNGFFVISDVYAKSPDSLDELKSFSLNSCMRSLHNLEKLKNKLEESDFSLAYSEDCSHFLNELLVIIVFSYGSMGEFWKTAAGNCISGEDFYRALKKCRPGYFLLIARKREAAYE